MAKKGQPTIGLTGVSSNLPPERGVLQRVRCPRSGDIHAIWPVARHHEVGSSSRQEHNGRNVPIRRVRHSQARSKQRGRVTRPWSLVPSGWRSGDRHREFGEVCGGEALLKAGASARLPCDEGSRFAAMMRAVTPNTAQSSTFAIVEPVISRRPRRGFAANGTSELPGLGKSSIKRSAIALASASVHRAPQAIALSTTPISARQRPSAARIIQLPPSKDRRPVAQEQKGR